MRLYVINPVTENEVPADEWVGCPHSLAISARWLVLRDGDIAFRFSKNNLYDRCMTKSFYECTRSASQSGCRLGTEDEWRAVFEAKAACRLDAVLSSIDGDVICGRYEYTEKGTVMRHLLRNRYLETFDRQQLAGNVEIFARLFKSMPR